MLRHMNDSEGKLTFDTWKLASPFIRNKSC